MGPRMVLCQQLQKHIMQNNDGKSVESRFQFQKFSWNIQEKTWRKKIYAQNGKSKNSKIHYLLFVMSIERTIEMTQKLFNFVCCWVFFAIWFDRMMPFPTQNKSKIHWDDPIFTYRPSWQQLFYSLSVRQYHYGRSNWKANAQRDEK